VKITVFAYFLPLIAALCLLQINWFFSYPSFSSDFWIILAIFSLPMFLVMLLYIVTPHQRNPPKSLQVKQEVFFSATSVRLFLILSILYIVSMGYRYFVIGSVLTDGVTGARYAEIASGPGQGGIFTGVTVFTAAAPVFLLLAAFEKVSKVQRISRWIWAIGVLGLAMSFLTGGRNPLLINMVFLLIFGMIVPSTSLRQVLRNKNMGVDIRILSYGALLGAVGFSMYLFVERGLLRTDDLIDRAIITAAESNFIFVPERQPDWLNDSLYFAILSLHNYITVAFYYFDQLLVKGLQFGHVGGSYNFFSFFRVAESLFGEELVVDLATELPFVGAYYTLPGSIYIDFGISGVLIAGVLLPILAISQVSKAMKGNFSSAPLGALVLTILVFSPLYNCIALGSGPSLLVFSIIYAFTRTKQKPIAYGNPVSF